MNQQALRPNQAIHFILFRPTPVFTVQFQLHMQITIKQMLSCVSNVQSVLGEGNEG